MTLVQTSDHLPEQAPHEPRTQLIVGTTLAALAGSTLVGGMLAVWTLLRERITSGGLRFPGDYVITEVASNVMLMTVWAIVFFSVWAAYSAVTKDRAHAGTALILVTVMAVAFINAQAFVWGDMEVPIDESYYGALFYALTGTMMAIIIAGLIFTLVGMFRMVSGRLEEAEILIALTVYWTFAALAYSAIWFLVYVTK